MLSEEEKKAIERIEDTFYQDLGKGINKFQKITLYEDSITDIRKLLNLIEKQNKIIDKMAEDIILLKECGWLTNITNKQDAIEYYIKLVEEEK